LKTLSALAIFAPNPQRGLWTPLGAKLLKWGKAPIPHYSIGLGARHGPPLLRPL